MPDKAETWKKRSFSKEIALRTVIDKDGTVYEGMTNMLMIIGHIQYL